MLGLPAAEFCVNSETQGPHTHTQFSPPPQSPSDRRDPESHDKSVDTN